MYNKILEIAKSIRGDIDFEHEEALVDGGLLDSFDVVAIVGEIMEVYEVEIGVDDLEPENFNSIELMCKLVERLQEED